MYLTKNGPRLAFDILEKGSIVLGTAGSRIFYYVWRQRAKLLSKTSSFYSPGSSAKRKIKLRAGTRDGAADMRNGHDIS